MPDEVTRIGTVRTAIAEKGRKRFTAQDLAEATALDPKEISIMLSSETRLGRLERIDTGVYRVRNGAYSELAPGETMATTTTNGAASSTARDALRSVSVGTPPELTFAAETADGLLFTDEDGQLWVARRAKLDIE